MIKRILKVLLFPLALFLDFWLIIFQLLKWLIDGKEWSAYSFIDVLIEW